MRHIESWSCHNCHKRIHAWPCQYCGIGEDEHPDELALRNLSEEIAAKDAELQKANYLLTRREKLIKKLGKKVQRLESANALVAAREADAEIAAKDAELQKANYLLTRREKLIKKLGKKVQRLESANAGLLALLQDAHVHVVCSGKAGWGRVVLRIEQALKEAGVHDV